MREALQLKSIVEKSSVGSDIIGNGSCKCGCGCAQ
jgi:hypothetical protein